MDQAQKLGTLDFSSHDGLNAVLIDLRYAALARFFRGKKCLELGAADGRGVRALLERFASVTAVDGSAPLLERLARDVQDDRLEVIHSLFEDLALDRTFDTVLLGHILEHVDDPSRVIAVARRHLAQGGVLIADVPNANSIHRELGVKLGMLAKTTDLNEADVRIGHQRVYVPERFRSEFTTAGFKIVHAGGFFLKPLSNTQMEKSFSRQQIEGLFALGEDHPEIAAEIYVACEL